MLCLILKQRYKLYSLVEFFFYLCSVIAADRKDLWAERIRCCCFYTTVPINTWKNSSIRFDPTKKRGIILNWMPWDGFGAARCYDLFEQSRCYVPSHVRMIWSALTYSLRFNVHLNHTSRELFCVSFIISYWHFIEMCAGGGKNRVLARKIHFTLQDVHMWNSTGFSLI